VPARAGFFLNLSSYRAILVFLMGFSHSNFFDINRQSKVLCAIVVPWSNADIGHSIILRCAYDGQKNEYEKKLKIRYATVFIS
jgi:hypothetical protein